MNGFVSSYTNPRGDSTKQSFGRDSITGNLTSVTYPATTYPAAAQSPSPLPQVSTAYGYQPEPTPSGSQPNFGVHYVNSFQNENQKTTTYTRDSANYRITAIDYPDNSGHEEFLFNPMSVYSAFAVLKRHLRANGAYEFFQYYSNGLLQYAYNPKSNGSDPTGAEPRTTFVYYPSGPWTDRVQTVTDARGHTTTYAYEMNGQTPIAGRGLVSKITHPQATGEQAATSRSFGYDRWGYVTSVTDERNHTTKFVYDDYHRILKIQRPHPSSTDPTQQDPMQYDETTFDYKPTGTGEGSVPYSRTANAPTTITGAAPNNRSISKSYDGNLWLTSIVQDQTTGGINAKTQYHHDPAGNIDMVTDPDDAIEAGRHTTTITYDERNRRTTMTTPPISADGNAQYVTTWCYDQVGNLTQVTMPDFEPGTKNLTYKYIQYTPDALNRITDVYDQELQHTIYNYNPSGTLNYVTDANNNTTNFSYDERDLKKSVLYPPAAPSPAPAYQSSASWTYDNNGNLSTRTTPSGLTQSFTYDERDRRTSMRWSNAVDYADFTYYANNLLATATNPVSTVTRTYDAADRLLADNQQVAQVVNAPAMAFNPAPNVTSRQTHGTAGTYDVYLSLTGAAGVECRSGGANGDYTLIIDFSNQSASDATVTSVGGAIVSAGIGKAGTPTYSGKIVTVPLSGVSNAQLLVVDLSGLQISSQTEGATYTQTGSLTIPMHVLIGDVNGDGVVNSGDVMVERNDSGQTTGSSNFRADVNADGVINSADDTTVRGYSGTAVPGNPPGAMGVIYAYDNDSNVVGLQVANTGYAYGYGYDNLGRLTDIYQGGVRTGAGDFQYQYRPSSFVTERDDNLNFTKQTSTPDELHRLVQRGLTGTQLMSGNSGGGDMGGFQTMEPYDVYGETYTYSPMSRIIQIYRGEDQQSDTFQYKYSGELKNATYGGRNDTVSYNLDAVGNRDGTYGKIDGGAWYGYMHDALNQYTQADNLTVTNNSSASNNPRGEHQIANYNNVNYSYLNDTFLSSAVATNNTNSYQMGYDALGRRVISLINGNPTYYVYDGLRPIMEFSGELSASSVYGLGLDEIINRDNYGADEHFYQNWQGSTVVITGGDGSVLEYYRYDAFGTPFFYSQQTMTNAVGWPTDNNTSQENNRFLFTGREWVQSFGFYEFRARAYNPAIGKFLTEDPIGMEGGDTNLFRYCGGDPVNSIDPSGLEDFQIDKFLEDGDEDPSTGYAGGPAGGGESNDDQGYGDPGFSELANGLGQSIGVTGSMSFNIGPGSGQSATSDSAAGTSDTPDEGLGNGGGTGGPISISSGYEGVTQLGAEVWVGSAGEAGISRASRGHLVYGSVFGGSSEKPGTRMPSAYGNYNVGDQMLGVALPAWLPPAQRWVIVTAVATGRSEIVPVIDIGPWHDNGSQAPSDPYWLLGRQPMAERQPSTNGAGIDISTATATRLGIPWSRGYIDRHGRRRSGSGGGTVIWEFLPMP